MQPIFIPGPIVNLKNIYFAVPDCILFLFKEEASQLKTLFKD